MLNAPEEGVSSGHKVNPEPNRYRKGVGREQKGHDQSRASRDGRGFNQGSGNLRGVLRDEAAARAQVNVKSDIGQAEKSRRRESNRAGRVLRIETRLRRPPPTGFPRAQRIVENGEVI